MGIRFASLPPDLRRRILAEVGRGPAARVRRRAPSAPRVRRLSRVCACGFEMFRPDLDYPEHCDGCGQRWPESGLDTAPPPA